jgi:hypothetical protein
MSGIETAEQGSRELRKRGDRLRLWLRKIDSSWDVKPLPTDDHWADVVIRRGKTGHLHMLQNSIQVRGHG